MPDRSSAPGPRNARLRPRAVVTAACTFAGLLGMLALPPSLVATASCIALMGIGGRSTMNLVHTTTADIDPLPVRATALGWSNGTSLIGAFLGPVIGGTAVAAGRAHGLFTAFDAAAGICLVAVFTSTSPIARRTRLRLTTPFPTQPGR